MSTPLAIFVTDFLKDYIEKALCEFPQANEFEVHLYRDFNNLVSIYKNLPKTVQGVVVTSSIAARILKLSFPDAAVPIRAFDNDNAGVYKLFLALLNEDRTLNLERVFADVLDLVQLKPNSFLFGPDVGNLSDLAQARVAEMSLGELLTVDEVYAAKHLELWRNGQIDISVTRVSLIVERLKQAGLNVRFAYPDVSFVRNVLSAAFQEVIIKGLTDNLPCSVLVTVRRNKELTGDKLMRKVDELGKHIGMFAAGMKLNYHVQKREWGFEIFTNHKTAGIITEGFTVCKLRSFLSSRLDLKLDIGYGIGLSLYQAHVNGMDAARAAYKLPLAAACLKNERDELTVLLEAEKNPVDSLGQLDLVEQLARESGLSRLAVQNIISAVNNLPDGNVTSEDLSQILSLTKQSASRFLSVLHKSGFACIVGQKETASKGRPEYIYQLTI